MKSDIVVSIGNKYINIEMNSEYYKGVFDKNDAYLNKLKMTMYKAGESYYKAGQVIQINFNEFYHFKEKRIYISLCLGRKRRTNWMKTRQ